MYIYDEDDALGIFMIVTTFGLQKNIKSTTYEKYGIFNQIGD